MGKGECVVVDIDDTIVDTRERRRAALSLVLGGDVPKDLLGERIDHRSLLKRLRPDGEELWKRFWRIILCWDEAGPPLLHLDKPIPHAPQALKKWGKRYHIVYLTGRTRNMEELTKEELKRFGFPVDGASFFMAEDPEEFMVSPLKVRAALFPRILEKWRVVRVVDDIPIYFTVYKRYKVPERIGILRRERYTPETYLRHGATRVVEDWRELLITP